jgi:hypothetical protein
MDTTAKRVFRFLIVLCIGLSATGVFCQSKDGQPGSLKTITSWLTENINRRATWRSNQNPKIDAEIRKWTVKRFEGCTLELNLLEDQSPRRAHPPYDSTVTVDLAYLKEIASGPYENPSMRSASFVALVMDGQHVHVAWDTHTGSRDYVKIVFGDPAEDNEVLAGKVVKAFENVRSACNKRR